KNTADDEHDEQSQSQTLKSRLERGTRNVSEVDVSLSLRTHNWPRYKSVFNREVEFDITTFSRLRDQFRRGWWHRSPGKFFPALVEESPANTGRFLCRLKSSS